MAIETIQEINGYINSIRYSINQLLRNSNEEELSPNDTLKKYAETLSKIKVSNTTITQKMYALYVWAESDEDASNKSIPTITWNKGDNDNYPDSPTIDESSSEWKTIVPNTLDESLLYVRFVTIGQGGEAVYGTPLRLTGPAGPKGEDGLDGRDSIISTEIFRIVELYHVGQEEPKIQTFEIDRSNNVKFTGVLDPNRLYYTNGENKIYIDNENSDWKLTYDNSDTVWSISIEMGSIEYYKLLTTSPINKQFPTIINTAVYYLASSDRNSIPSKDADWKNTRDAVALSDEFPYLWSKTVTTYSNGALSDNIVLVQELPTVIKNIKTEYIATTKLSEEPNEDSNWQDTFQEGPVVWKKETTTYTNNVAGNSDTRTVISPVYVQGEPGIKYVGKYDSVADLENFEYSDSTKVGQIGVVIGGETYVWWGTDEPNLGGVEYIPNNYWLNIGASGISLIAIDYDDLVTLKDNSNLIPGTQYKINENSVFVRALDSSTLDPNAAVKINANAVKCNYSLSNDTVLYRAKLDPKVVLLGNKMGSYSGLIAQAESLLDQHGIEYTYKDSPTIVNGVELQVNGQTSVSNRIDNFGTKVRTLKNAISCELFTDGWRYWDVDKADYIKIEDDSKYTSNVKYIDSNINKYGTIWSIVRNNSVYPSTEFYGRSKGNHQIEICYHKGEEKYIVPYGTVKSYDIYPDICQYLP